MAESLALGHERFHEAGAEAGIGGVLIERESFHDQNKDEDELCDRQQGDDDVADQRDMHGAEYLHEDSRQDDPQQIPGAAREIAVERSLTRLFRAKVFLFGLLPVQLVLRGRQVVQQLLGNGVAALLGLFEIAAGLREVFRHTQSVEAAAAEAAQAGAANS